MISSKRAIIIIAAVVVVLAIPTTIMLLASRGSSPDALEQALILPITQTENPYQFTIAPSAIGQIQITPLSVQGLSVARDSAFLVSSETQTLTQEYLRDFLTFSTGEDFLLTPEDDNAFLLQLGQELSPMQVYNFIYSPPGMQSASFAFQTQEALRVISTTPANNTFQIPQDTGIEVTFNRYISLAEFEAAFSIEPHVTGEFLRRENTLIFAPHQNLAPGTSYIVTIAAGLICAYGNALEDERIFRFETRWGDNVTKPFSISGSAYETFLPWSEVFIALNIANTFPHRDFYVSLYDLQTPENFLNFTPSVSNPGEPIENFELELVSFEITNWWSTHYLFLGRTLPEGYYLATIRSPHDSQGFVLHKFIQVSAISVYSLAIEGETVFWIHDAATHEPAHGAEITIGDTTVVTDSQGVAITPTYTQDNQTAITISYGNYLPFAFTTRTFAPRDLWPNERFLTYIYTDRSVYRTNDTIDVFGVIIPRPGQEFLPDDTFVLQFANRIEIPIDLDEHGAFNKRIPVTNMFGWWAVEVEANGERLMAAHIEFLDYTNLSFVAEGSLDRFAYFDSEYANFEVSVTNFAELPLVGVDLRHSWGSGEVIATTNAHGIATGTLPAREWGSWRPSIQSFWFSIAGDAQASQTISLPFIIAPMDIMMEVEMPNDRTAILTTSRVTLDKLNAASSLDAATELLRDIDSFRAERVDIDFTVEITRHTTTRTVYKQWYDHINRRTITRYDFTTTSENVSITEGRTVNGVATINNLPISNDPMVRYSIGVSYEDSQGRRTGVSIREESWWSWYQPQETSRRSFHFDFESGVRQNTTSFREWHGASGSLRLGETGNITLLEGQIGWNSRDEWVTDVAPVTEGRMLVVMARDGIISATVGNPQGIPITFPEEAISNAIVYGAYFDAGHIFPVNQPISVQYNFLERNITVDLTFDQESYSPGSEVTVNVHTTDINGDPVPARVTISVVDEASMLSRQDEWGYDWWFYNRNFLSRLYSSGVISPNNLSFEQFASFRQHEFGSTPLDGGGIGGNGGDNMLGGFRHQFVDNPIFEVMHTDQSGTGTHTFTLPDQLTSWRVTALALTTDGFAGDKRENIISTLPFSVNLLLTNEYIVGDDIAAVAVITAPSDIGTVELIFEVLQNGEVIHTYSTNTNRRAEYNAGKLPAGSYIMRVAAITDTHQDGIKLPFTVVDGSLIIQEWTSFQLSPENPNISELEMRNFPIRVTFTNGNMRPLANILRSTTDHTSFRTDQIAAAAFSDVFFRGISEEEIAETVRRQVHADTWRGIAELTYERADFYYTARFVASFPLFVNREGIIRYVRRELEHQSYPRRHAAGLWALAAVGEPVLVEILELVAYINDLFDPLASGAARHYTAQLYLVAALVSIGDYNAAQQLFLTMDSIDSIQYMSATAMELANTLKLFINTAINPPAAWEYLRQTNTNTFVSNTPERVNFVRRAVVLGYNVSEIMYYLDGETHNLRLENFERKSLHITKEQYDNLNLVPISGETDFFVNFYSYSPNTWPENERHLTITRTISQENDLVRIDLHIELPPDTWGSFVIYDRLPSNLRFVPVLGHTNEYMPIRNTQQQLMEIRFWQSINGSRTRTLTYYAMQLFDGDMADGTTYIHGGSWNRRLWGATK